MTPSKSGSRTEERGRGISNAGRPFRSPRTVGLLPFSIRRSPPWLRPAPTRRLCGGQIQVTLPVGRSALHPCAPSRADPLASAGRSAFTLRGSDPLRQLRPALVCPWHDPLLLCEAIRSAFGSLRLGSADPLRNVWLTLRCAGNPLAAAGPIPGPGGPRALVGAPATPGSPAGANSHGPGDKAVSPSAPGLAAPTALGSP